MEKILADTSAWITSFSKVGHETLKTSLREKILEDNLYMTGMVLLELLQGTRSEKDYQTLHKRLAILPFISTDDFIWGEVAHLSRLLRAKGVQAKMPDLFIAQIAMKHHCILLHCDRDYEHIAKHCPLKTLPFLP